MKSSLTEEELKLVSAIFSEKFNPIRNEFDKEEKQVQWSETSNSLPKYTDWLNRFARANISIEVDCYVEVFKKINKFPNNNDLVEIQTLLLRIKDRFVKKLSEYFSNPFSENFSKSTVEATTYTFSEELKQ